MMKQLNQKIKKYLRKLISEEYFCSQTYLFFIEAVKFDKKHTIDELFAEISNDEYNDHYKKLINWAKKYDYSDIIPTCYNDFIRYADKKSVDNFNRVKNNENIDYYLKLAIELEKNAIISYQEAIKLDELKENDELRELYSIFLNNFYDEQEHLQLLISNLLIIQTSSIY